MNYLSCMARIPLTVFLSLFCLAVSASVVDTVESPVIGGIRQYIQIKGKDTSNPVLLFLHGGPGGSVLSYSDKFTSRLQEHFVVVQWDQRETGRTLELNPTNAKLTFSLFQQDTYELIRFLLDKFRHQKIYLVGHSWGTALGFQMAKQYPDLIHAYVAIGSMTAQLESETISLDLLKEKAIKDKNKKALSELALVQIPFENGEQLFYHRKWLLDFMGSKRSLSKEYVKDWSATWLDVFNEASEVNLIDSTPTLNCPVYFFAGRKDYQTNSWLTEKYYEKLIAPKKDFFWFEHSGHGIPSSEPAQVQKIIVEVILPETFPASGH
jgi:pimeloyl-ACP methyl ester carboxylesterase